MIQTRSDGYVVIFDYTRNYVLIKNAIEEWCDSSNFEPKDVWYFKSEWHDRIIIHVPTIEIAMEAELRFA